MTAARLATGQIALEASGIKRRQGEAIAHPAGYTPPRKPATHGERVMTWAQMATLIVSIAATVAAGAGVIVLSVNGIHSQVAALQAQAAADRAEAAADRRAWQASMDAFQTEMRRLAERQAHVEGALSTAAAGQP